MPYKKTLILLLFMAAICLDTIAQSSCPDSIEYKTNTIGNGKENIPMNLLFQIEKDSISVIPYSTSGKSNYHFLDFKIISKKCNWDSNYSEGESFYDLIVKDKEIEKQATLHIFIKDKKGQIVLSYDEGKEPRVFDMVL